jgi:hypothetical protein
MIKGIGLLALSLALTFSSGLAKADYIVYTNRAMFEAALKTESTETFSELGPNLQSITGSGNFLLSGSSASLGGFYPGNGTFLLGPTSSSSTDGITVAFPANTYTGAGADVNAYDASGMVSFFGTTSQGEKFAGSVMVQGTNPNGPFGFLGVTTTSPTDYITSLTFSTAIGANQNVIIDSVSIGTAIPEPASMALFVTGALVIGVGAIRRLSRSKSV